MVLLRRVAPPEADTARLRRAAAHDRHCSGRGDMAAFAAGPGRRGLRRGLIVLAIVVRFVSARDVSCSSRLIVWCGWRPGEAGGQAQGPAPTRLAAGAGTKLFCRTLFFLCRRIRIWYLAPIAGRTFGRAPAGGAPTKAVVWAYDTGRRGEREGPGGTRGGRPAWARRPRPTDRETADVGTDRGVFRTPVHQTHQ
jgi:hypothetical protein